MKVVLIISLLSGTATIAKTVSTWDCHIHRTHMWQSRVEIEHYSVVYALPLQRAITQNFCYGWGSYMLCKCVKYIHEFIQCV